MECLGLTLVARTEKKEGEADFKPLRMRCSLCSKQTSMFCTGCKRYLCVDKDRRVELGEVGAPHVCKMKQVRKHTETGSQTVGQYFAMRSCYHIAHEKVLDEYWEQASGIESYFTKVSNRLYECDDNESGQENARHNTL